MTTPAIPLRATSELVAIAWIGTIPAVAELGGRQMVATTLPSDDTAWAATGFVTVAVVGGSPDPYLPVKKPVLQVDAWATKPGSNKPPWWQANVLIETIRYATLQRTGFNRLLTLSAGSVPYPAAVVDSACMLTEPRRSYADAADYAHYICDLQLTWRTPADVIP